MEAQTGRRIETRLPFDAGRIDLLYDGELLSTTTTRNLSWGGVCFGRLNIPVCSPVKVFIELPAGETVMLDGEVAWRRLGGTGVCFTQEPPPALASYLHQVCI
jgi:hypothetical protein